MNRLLSGLVGFTLAGLAAASPAQAPRMTAAQGRLLYAAGGFPISADGRNPTNRCGRAANPTITFVDMNADGRREALFVDTGACYQPDGRWYAVATQNADGIWRRVVEGSGTVRAAGTMANGWFLLNAPVAARSPRSAIMAGTMRRRPSRRQVERRRRPLPLRLRTRRPHNPDRPAMPRSSVLPASGRSGGAGKAAVMTLPQAQFMIRAGSSR